MNTVASSKVENFVESLNLPKDAVVLLETVEDCQNFFENFYMRNRYLVDDLLDFREYKIEKSEINLDTFVEKCYNNEVGMKKAFESTFYQTFTDEHIQLVVNAIDSGKTSLEQLFKDFLRNPNKNILKNVI